HIALCRRARAWPLYGGHALVPLAPRTPAPSQMISRAFVCIAGFALAFASAQTASARPTAAISVSYKAIPLSSANLQQNRVGKLVYRGGLQLSSPDPRF